MPFPTFSNADVQFADKELTWRSYTIKEVLPTIQRIELISKKKCAKVALNKNVEAFILHMASLILKMTIHLAWKAKIALLLVENITITVICVDLADIFLEKLVLMLSEQTGINEPAIKLVESKQLSCRSIYSLKMVRLEILKTYIETNLANSFTRLSKFSAGASILFLCKSENILQLCIDY